MGTGRSREEAIVIVVVGTRGIAVGQIETVTAVEMTVVIGVVATGETLETAISEEDKTMIAAEVGVPTVEGKIKTVDGKDVPLLLTATNFLIANGHPLANQVHLN